MFYRTVMQRQDELLPDEIIAPAQDHHKLISARPVNRAVLEDVADHPAGLEDVFVARLVAKGIVNDLQAVHIADDNGKSVCVAR